uniref:Lens intrinsic membrane protein 2 n=1 Tax=Monopterus albus TaxID=43700 RepID=A0A3Q3JXG7_MONAL
MGGGLLCAGVGSILLIVSTATDYWMQHRQPDGYRHQSLWCYCTPGKCFPHNDAHWDATHAVRTLSVLACSTGIITGIMDFIHYSFFDSFSTTFAAGSLFFISCKFLGVYYGKQYGAWRFSWPFVIGWLSVAVTFFSGKHSYILYIFYMCAFRMRRLLLEDPNPHVMDYDRDSCVTVVWR